MHRRAQELRHAKNIVVHAADCGEAISRCEAARRLDVARQFSSGVSAWEKSDGESHAALGSLFVSLFAFAVRAFFFCCCCFRATLHS